MQAKYLRSHWKYNEMEDCVLFYTLPFFAAAPSTKIRTKLSYATLAH